MKNLIKPSAGRWLLSASLLLFIFNSCKKESKLFSGLEENASSYKASNSDAATKYNTFKGPEVEVGNGYARSFVTISHTGVPEEIGVIFTDGALSGLPSVNTPYVLELHDKALAATPFQHIAVGWSANGHPLPGTFIAPHFDVRFFMMNLADRLAIPAPPASGFNNLPPAGYMPANYTPDAPAPQVGRHWTDNSFTAGVPVTHALILGSIDGAFTFVSPIVVRTELITGQSFSIAYSQPQSFSVHGYYPTMYNIYQDDKQNHYVTLSNFVWH
jgi:hypothetical protein